jgi:hypothetical protein
MTAGSWSVMICRSFSSTLIEDQLGIKCTRRFTDATGGPLCLECHTNKNLALVARKFKVNAWWPKTTVNTMVAHEP